MIALQPRFLALAALCAVAAAIPPVDMNVEHTNVSEHVQRSTPLDPVLAKAPQPGDAPAFGPNMFGTPSSVFSDVPAHTRDTEEDIDAKLPADAPAAPPAPHARRSMPEDVAAKLLPRMVIKRLSPPAAVPTDVSSKHPTSKRNELDPDQAMDDVAFPDVSFPPRSDADLGPRSRIARQALTEPVGTVVDSVWGPGFSGSKDRSDTRVANILPNNLPVHDNDPDFVHTSEGENSDRSSNADTMFYRQQWRETLQPDAAWGQFPARQQHGASVRERRRYYTRTRRLRHC